ncbi:MAG: hypothetical protein DRR00_28245, partial [Candidatus Parabeggiatoa sp. nov. 3]
MSTQYKRTNWVQRLGRLLLASLLAGFISSLAYAVPTTTNYQGYLENTDSEPLNATVNMTFALYATAQGGNALWTETHQQVKVTHGVFSLILGNTTPFDENSLDGERYFGVTVGSDPEMTPRQQLTSAFYAIRAAVAESVKAATVETEAIADGAVTAEKIAPKTITGDKIADLFGHNVTELDDVADAGSGKIISEAEREKLQGLGTGGGVFQLNGNNAYYTAGNVGIGTTSPISKLDVVSGNWNNLIRFDSGEDDGGRMYSTYENASPYLNFIEYDDPFVFSFKQTSDNDEVKMSFHNGNVGIGTTNPIRTLHLQSPTISSEIVLEVANYQADKRKWNIVVDGETSHSA